MNGTTGAAALLWEWQRLIFVLPFGVGALFLLLSTVRGGGHRHSFGHGGGHHVGTTHAPAHSGRVTATHHHQTRTHRSADASRKSAGGPTPISIALTLFGIGRAPLPMVIEFFLICWGLTGFWSVENLTHSPHPNLFQMLPILALAFGGGWLGSRGAAEIIGRVLPHEESTVVSGDALYGLTGKIAFPVSEKSGRVHIYDEFGTLHDEMCRVPDGHPLITRGSTVRIVDRDMASGRLIVEETAPPTSMANR